MHTHPPMMSRLAKEFSSKRSSRQALWLLVGLLVALAGTACKRVPPSPPQSPAQTASRPAPTDPPIGEIIWLEELAVDPSDRRVGFLLHGYGSDEHDLVGLARELGLRGPLVSFRAPQPAGNGYAWFPIDFTRGGTRYVPDAADAVLKQLAAHIGEIREQHVGYEAVVVGFSQGGMLAGMLAVEHPEVVDRAVMLSGALPRPVQARGVPAPIIQVHGTADTVVTLERARQAKQWLEAAGARVDYREYEGLAHRTSAAELADVTGLLNTPASKSGEMRLD